MKKKSLYVLGEPFYLNVMQYFGGKDTEKWYPVFEDKYIGSNNRNKAVELRNELFNYLFANGSRSWRRKHFKTVKVNYF